MGDLCDLIRIIQALFHRIASYWVWKLFMCFLLVALTQGNCYWQLKICFNIEEPQKIRVCLFFCVSRKSQSQTEFFRDRFNVEKQLLSETAATLLQSVIQSPSTLCVSAN